MTHYPHHLRLKKEMRKDENMSQPANVIQFLTIAKSCEIWRSISSAIMTVTNEAQFEAGPNGIGHFRTKGRISTISLPCATKIRDSNKRILQDYQENK